MLDPDVSLFLAIVAEGSLAAAGRALGLSTPMVSKRLARLEAKLGAPLLRRTTRRLEPTAKGARFHADMLALAAAADEARARLGGDGRRPHGTLRISAPTSFGRLHIAPIVPAFLDAFPTIELDLKLSDSFDDLLSERIDLAIRITGDVGRGLVAERLAANRRLLCAAPGYLAVHGTPSAPDDLADHHLLAAEGQLPWRLASPGCVHIVEGESRVRTNSSEVVRELALAGAGIALRSLWDVSAELEKRLLVPLLPGIEGSSNTGIYAVRPQERLPSPAVEAFATHLRTALADAPWERSAPLG